MLSALVVSVAGVVFVTNAPAAYAVMQARPVVSPFMMLLSEVTVSVSSLFVRIVSQNKVK